MSARPRIKLAIWTIAAAAWAALCLFLSWQTGEGTGRLSLTLARALLRMLALVGIRPEENAFHMALRLAAHFGVFFVAGFLWRGAASSLMVVVRMPRWADVAFGLLAAAAALLTDVPKVWIPGRHLTWSEALLNALGALAGYIVLWLIQVIISYVRERRFCTKGRNN